MQNQWALDKSKAAKVGQSSYISGNTAEIYQIQSAAWKTNAKQDGSKTYYLSLHIINSERSSAHIDIYYGNSAGEHWSGENLIHAMILCANVPAISQAQGQYQEYDFDIRKDVTRTGFVAPELVGKKVGMFLAENYYFNSNQGEVKKGGLNLFNVFDAKTRQLPIEKANNQPANPDEFTRVLEATIKSSEKSLEKANSQAGIATTHNQFTQNAPQPVTQQNPATYKRQAAPQQIQQQPVQQQSFNNQMTAAATPGPSDDDIPFAPAFGG